MMVSLNIEMKHRSVKIQEMENKFTVIKKKIMANRIFMSTFLQQTPDIFV